MVTSKPNPSAAPGDIDYVFGGYAPLGIRLVQLAIKPGWVDSLQFLKVSNYLAAFYLIHFYSCSQELPFVMLSDKLVKDLLRKSQMPKQTRKRNCLSFSLVV